MKIVLPAQNIAIQTPTGIDPIWYGRLKAIEANLNDGIMGQGALALNATTGFGQMPTCKGKPTGVPVAQSGYAPFVYDLTTNKLWIYNGAWRGVVVS